MSSPIALLVDDFTDGVQSPAWAGSFVLGSATKAETGGQAQLTLPSSTAGTHQAYYRTSGAYDFTAGGCFIVIGTMVSTAVAASMYFDCYVDASNILRWSQTSGTLVAQTITAGVTTGVYSVAWNASTYKYLRIRESGGNILFDSSSNGTSWTNRHTTAGLPFAVTSLYVQFGVAGLNIASPGSLRIDDVNPTLPAPSSTWRYTTADWSISNRLMPVTLAATANTQGVLVTADTMDSAGVLSGNVRYFAGPLGSTSGGYLQLTEYASLALAQASAFQIPIDGRVDLPAMVDARYMRLYHRSTDASAHTLREFVPRRIVQTDDLEAESIRAINIAAGAVTADKIFVLTLGAITANIGKLNIDTTGYLYQGTGTGDAPTTGLKIFNSGGIGKLSTYNTGVEQVTFDTDGKLKAGAGTVLLDVNGITIDTPLLGAEQAINKVKWKTGATAVFEIYGTRNPDYTGNMVAYQNGSQGGLLSLLGQATGAFDDAEIQVKGATGATNGLISFNADLVYSFSGFSVGLSAGDALPGYLRVQNDATILKGLNLGTATGAPIGGIHMDTYIQQPESSQPATPAANTMRQWTTDDGAGNTMVAWVSSTATPMGLTTATTAGATAGASGAPPAQVAGYLVAFIAGARRKIPFYNV
jgi:hypothetical protein